MTDPSVRGANGGNARAAKLTKEQRSAIAKQAAAKRWAKPKEENPLVNPEIKDAVNHIAKGLKRSIEDILQENNIHAEDAGLEPTVYPTYGGLERGSMPMVEPNITPPIAAQAPPIQQPPIYIPPHPEPPKPTPKRRKPMVKEFGKAHSYAEKRLSEAIKERAEAMGKVAMLNAEIPSLVQIIKALGMTPNMNGFQDFTAHIPNTMPTYQQPQYQPPIEHSPAAPNNIDPALFQANSNPLPGLAPALANAPVVANKPLGGAIDLDFVPVDDEGPELPKMGGGWQ